MTEHTNHGRHRGRKLTSAGLAGAALLGGLAIAVASAGPASGHGWEGKAVLRDATGDRVGTLRLEGDDGRTRVKVSLHSIAVGDTYHGLHVHANGANQACDPASGFSNVGPHWDLSGASHGHHDGDLPSVLVQADGTATARSVTGRVDPAKIDGRAVILHAGPDNFANIPNRYATGTPPVAGPDTATKNTGDSGDRIACGIIQMD